MEHQERIRAALEVLERKPSVQEFMDSLPWDETTISVSNYGLTCPVAQWLQQECGFPVRVLARICI